MEKEPQGALSYIQMINLKRMLYYYAGIPVAATISAGGCITLSPQEERSEIAEVRSSVGEELVKIKAEINSINGRLDELSHSISRIDKSQLQKTDETAKMLNKIKGELEQIEKKQVHERENLKKRIDIVIEETAKENDSLRGQIKSLREFVNSTSAAEGEYTVQNGDTLSVIAHSFGVPVKSIMDANNISNPDSIRTGQKLIIPKRH